MNKVASINYKYNSITKKDFKVIFYGVFGFFISLGVVFSFISPLAIPFLALFLGQSIMNFSIIYLCVAFGLHIAFHGVFFYTYFTAITILLCINVFFNFRKDLKEILTTITMGIICAITIFLGGLITVFNYDFSFYFFLCFLIFAIYSFIMPTVLHKGFTVFLLKGSVKPLSTEEIISICILFSGFVLGSMHFNFTYFNFNTFIIFTAILIVSYTSGSGNAVCAAFSLGFISFLSSKISTEQLTIFALFGIFSGILKTKIKIIFSGLFSLAFCYFYVNKDFFTVANLSGVFCAAICFYFLPEDWYLMLQSTFGQSVDNTKDYGEKIKYFTSSKLTGFSKSFNKLSKTFKTLAIKKEKLNQEDIGELINKVATKTCNGCEKRKHCWQSVFYTTYKLSTKLIENIEECDNKKINESRESFKVVCIKSDEFIENVFTYFEFYKSNMVWQNKICENKSLIADQLFDISNIFSEVSKELNEKIIFLPKYESAIYKMLENNSIFPSKIIVLKNQKEIFNIWISLDINIKERDAFKIIQKSVSSAIGTNVKIANSILQDNGKYEIFLEETYKYRVIFGVAKSKKNKSTISGDSYSTQNLENGETLLAISDGMGSGKSASIDSAAAIELFEEFIEAGFDKKLAIKLINSSLILKSTHDSFTTLDSLIIDLHKGFGQFLKIGAAPSFILRNGETITINSSSLPIGILSDIDTETVTKQLRDGDMIVMVSDGILNVIHTLEEQNKWIRKILKNFNGKNPQDLADYILLQATSFAKGEIEDDMTIVIGKIVKRAY